MKEISLMIVDKGNSDHILKKFGENLEAIKKKKNLTYRKIATNCNIDHSDIKKYVDGVKNPTLITIVELAKGFKVKPNDLFDFDFGVDFSEDNC